MPYKITSECSMQKRRPSGRQKSGVRPQGSKAIPLGQCPDRRRPNCTAIRSCRDTRCHEDNETLIASSAQKPIPVKHARNTECSSSELGVHPTGGQFQTIRANLDHFHPHKMSQKNIHGALTMSPGNLKINSSYKTSSSRKPTISGWFMDETSEEHSGLSMHVTTNHPSQLRCGKTFCLEITSTLASYERQPSDLEEGGAPNPLVKTSSYPLVDRNRQRLSPMDTSGPALDGTRNQSSLPSPTVCQNSNITEGTQRTFWRAPCPGPSRKYSDMMNTFERRQHSNTSLHLTPRQTTCTPGTSLKSEPVVNQEVTVEPQNSLVHGNNTKIEMAGFWETKSAFGGMVAKSAMNHHAYSSINADLVVEPIAKRIVVDLSECTIRRTLWSERAARPKYLRGYVWASVADRSACLPLLSSEQTVFAAPLPHPPALSSHLTPLNNFISSNPDLFQIITPILVDKFRSILTSHPNRMLVNLVCDGLAEGFWPYADLSTLDPNQSFDHEAAACGKRCKVNDEESAFLLQQRDKEMAVGRYS